MAMFSPAERHTYPAALMRPAKLAPWVNWSLLTIAFVQFCAEWLSNDEARRSGRWWRARCWLIRHTTAERSTSGEVLPTDALAPAQAAAARA